VQAGSSSAVMSIASSGNPESIPSRKQGALTARSLQSFWQSLTYFSIYRLVVASFFLATIILFQGTLNLGAQDPRLFLWTSTLYLLTSVLALGVVATWKNSFNLQLSLQVMADLVLLTILLFASGGSKSGLATMMLVVLVGAGLVGQGRLVLFYAATATVMLLAEQSLRVFQFGEDPGDFTRSGLISIGFFGSAIAARLLARRIVTNEELAHLRGIQLADQMRINERVIRDMQDGVLVIDAAGKVRQANPRAVSLLGLAEVPSTELAAYSPALAREYLGRKRRHAEADIVIQPSGSGRTVRARMLPAGEGENTLVFLEDLGRIQQEAQQVKLAALGRLTANMAHEIRNPLSAISQAAELLRDEPESRSIDRLVRIIGDNTKRLNHLVEEIMELGRRDRATLEAIELRPFLLQLVDELTLCDPAQASRIAINIAPELSVCFDRGHLHRVFSNLLGNALRYASTSPGAVRIGQAASSPPDRVELQIVDDGEGIDETAGQQIFEPFFTTRANGTGLGLYIARELCEANGARIILRENAPGANFCLSCRSKCLEPTSPSSPDD